MDYEKYAERGGMCPEGCVRCCTYGPDIPWRSGPFKKTIKNLKKKGKDIRIFFTQQEWAQLQKDLDENEYIFINKEYCVFADKGGVYGRRGCLIHDQKRPWVCRVYNGPQTLKCEMFEHAMDLAKEGVFNPLLVKKLPYEQYIEVLDKLYSIFFSPTLDENDMKKQEIQKQLKQYPILTINDALQFIAVKAPFS